MRSCSTRRSPRPSPLVDAGGYWGQGLRSAPTVTSWAYNNGTGLTDGPASAIALATPSLIEAWYDGTDIHVRVRGAAATTVAAPNISVLTNTLVMGASYNLVKFLDGRIAEPIAAKVNYSGADQTNLRAYYASIYGGGVVA